MIRVGRSDGIPSESGINLDADAVLKYCVKHPRYTIFTCYVYALV